MIAFHKLKMRFSYVFLLRLSAVFFTIKIFVMYLADSMVVFYLAQLCQIIGYGLLFPAMVSFIDAIMDKGEALRGQAMFYGSHHPGKYYRKRRRRHDSGPL